MYCWEHAEWPYFKFDPTLYRDRCVRYAEKVNFLAGAVHGLSDLPKLELLSYQMALEGSASSRIEGVRVKVEDIKHSITNNLRPDLGYRNVGDQIATNLAAIVTDNYRHFNEALSEEKLFEWHRQLIAHRTDLGQIGSYRNSADEMRIVSGPYGREIVHYVAPPSARLRTEMSVYTDWFNRSRIQYNGSATAPLRAGIAHLYFEQIHPFEDGNGRIGRVIAEKVLAQNLGYPLPFSISYIIAENTKAYYRAFQAVNRQLIIDEWLDYFFDVCLEAVDYGLKVYKFTLHKVRYYKTYGDHLTPPQAKAIHRMWVEGPKGFRGGMTTTKYRRITGVSPATATRDLARLTKLGALERRGGGRSTHYVLPRAGRDTL